MNHSLKLLLASVALGLSAAPFARADALAVVTTSTGFPSNDSLDWGQLGVNNESVASGSTATSSGGLGTTITFQTGGDGSTFLQCPATSCTWTGNFAPGTNLLTNIDFSGGDSGAITLTFGHGISTVGFQMEPDAGGPLTFSAVIGVYVDGTLAQTFTEPGTEEGHAENNSAGFYGIEDLSGADITAIVIDVDNCVFSGSSEDCDGVAIGPLSLDGAAIAAVPEPGTWALLGSGALLLGLRRRSQPRGLNQVEQLARR